MTVKLISLHYMKLPFSSNFTKYPLPSITSLVLIPTTYRLMISKPVFPAQNSLLRSILLSLLPTGYLQLDSSQIPQTQQSKTVLSFHNTPNILYLQNFPSWLAAPTFSQSSKSETWEPSWISFFHCTLAFSPLSNLLNLKYRPS